MDNGHECLTEKLHIFSDQITKSHRSTNEMFVAPIYFRPCKELVNKYCLILDAHGVCFIFGLITIFLLNILQELL